MTTSKTADERTIRVSLVCEAAPTSPDVEFGLQDKSGVLRHGIDESDGSLRFDGEIRVVTLADGTVRLRGDIVHGPARAPFVYLSCRGATGPDGAWIFRLKVPLAGIDGSAASVQGRVRASRGGTVPLLGSGWTRTVEQ